MVIRRFPVLVGIGLFLVLCVVGINRSANAQRRGTPQYNPTTVETISGSVVEVKEVAGPGRSGGIHLSVKTDSGTIEVHLGPSWYIEKQAFKFDKGDDVQVTGSKIKYQDSDIIIAREVKKGDKTLVLRDEKGYPSWSRGPKM